jgi:5-methylcytosine-specific restriction endonuclease McrA
MVIRATARVAGELLSVSVDGGRNTTVRDRHRRAIARSKPPCGICGEDIDYKLRFPDPSSFVVDHIIPFAKGGRDELGNKQSAHNLCNQRKAGKTPRVAPAPRVFVTHRHW